jgi:hypothetical protein
VPIKPKACEPARRCPQAAVDTREAFGLNNAASLGGVHIIANLSPGQIHLSRGFFIAGFECGLSFRKV